MPSRVSSKRCMIDLINRIYMDCCHKQSIYCFLPRIFCGFFAFSRNKFSTCLYTNINSFIHRECSELPNDVSIFYVKPTNFLDNLLIFETIYLKYMYIQFLFPSGCRKGPGGQRRIYGIKYKALFMERRRLF